MRQSVNRAYAQRARLLRSRVAFTLVELLVVIGIIAVLISILFPAFSRVRESSRQIKCINNLKQIGLAFTAYTNDSKGRFPFSASGGAPKNEDWIWWQTVPVAAGSGYVGRPVCDITQSSIAPYIGADMNPDIFRCPSDDYMVRLRMNGGGGGYYNYSYSMNFWLSSDTAGCPVLSAIPDTSNKILLVEENFSTINDGRWVPPLYDANGTYLNTSTDLLGIPHDPSLVPDSTLSPLPNASHRGNVLFVDNHAEFVSRTFAHYIGHVEPLHD